MTAFLNAILSRKQDEQAHAQATVSLVEMRDRAERSKDKPRGFRQALTRSAKPAVIAEFKRRSPSMGDIANEADPAEMARAYEAGGTAAMSVLTDAEGFGGSIAHLQAARAAISLPVLRKDFLLSEYDIYATRAAGADAALLIISAFEDVGTLSAMHALARALGLDVLVEAHDEAEVESAVALGSDLIGVNARDLRSFTVDRDLPVRLRALVPRDRTFVAESGIRSRADVAKLREAEIDAILIGETLMRAADPKAVLEEILR